MLSSSTCIKRKSSRMWEIRSVFFLVHARSHECFFFFGAEFYSFLRYFFFLPDNHTLSEIIKFANWCMATNCFITNS